MKSAFYEPYKYWDPFIERDTPPDDEDSPFEISQSPHLDVSQPLSPSVPSESHPDNSSVSSEWHSDTPVHQKTRSVLPTEWKERLPPRKVTLKEKEPKRK